MTGGRKGRVGPRAGAEWSVVVVGCVVTFKVLGSCLVTSVYDRQGKVRPTGEYSLRGVGRNGSGGRVGGESTSVVYEESEGEKTVTPQNKTKTKQNLCKKKINKLHK